MIIQSGTAILNSTDTNYDVVFQNTFDDGDVRVFPAIANHSSDETKEQLFAIITAVSPTGFSTTISGLPNTNNYILVWTAQGDKFASDVITPIEPYFSSDTPAANSFQLGPY